MPQPSQSTYNRPEPFSGAELLLLLLIAALMVTQFVPVVRPVLSWEDEALHAATSLALLRGQTHLPQPTVLADFPGTHSLVGFYGPATFWMGALALKLFGFSRVTWRVYAFAGNILLYAAGFLAFRVFGFSRKLAWLAPLALALSFEESMETTNSGRTDAWALGGVLLGVVLALRASQLEGRQARVYWLLSGGMAGVFLACTPRVWLFWFAAWVVLLAVALWNPPSRKHLLVGFAIANVSALATMSLVLLPAGLNPLTLLHNVAQGSRGDKVNASPLMGGTWGFGSTATAVTLYAVIALLLLATALYRKHLRAASPQAFWFMGIAVGTAALQILLLARSFNTSIYWGPLLLLAVTAAMLFVWQRSDAHTTQRTALLAGGCVVLLFLVALRAERATQHFLEQAHDSPIPLEHLIAVGIPAGSVVYGPPGTYFFPVEQAGSSYRYATEQTTPGLASVPYVLSTQTTFVPALCHTRGFALWPNDPAAPVMPPNLVADLGPKLGEIPDAPRTHAALERLMMHMPAGNVGDKGNGVILYTLKEPAACFAPQTAR